MPDALQAFHLPVRQIRNPRVQVHRHTKRWQHQILRCFLILLDLTHPLVNDHALNIIDRALIRLSQIGCILPINLVDLLHLTDALGIHLFHLGAQLSFLLQGEIVLQYLGHRFALRLLYLVKLLLEVALVLFDLDVGEGALFLEAELLDEQLLQSLVWVDLLATYVVSGFV